ncbi:MAG: FAD-linked oxidase C-terminal domain-containing protein [Armatimonadota bacterium]|nr:FAD-linked oxidase C-terminal domain-containing protein [Armatimonadota bacterium]
MANGRGKRQFALKSHCWSGYQPRRKSATTGKRQRLATGDWKTAANSELLERLLATTPLICLGATLLTAHLSCHQAGRAKMQRDALVRELQSIVGADGVIAQPSELVVYETDGLSVFKHPPDLVVFPRSTEEVVAVVRLLRRYRLPIIPRGAGTGLSGGALAERGGILITTTRMKRILQMDIRNRCVLVEAGVVNIHITNAVKAWNYHYAPDPSSQVACTIGGNIAENSGGPHTLKYGVTTNHILGVEVVLPDGEVVWLGGKTEESVGYDLRGVFIGSEGTFGIVTKAWVKLTRNPQSYRTMRVSFASVDDAAQAVSDIIAAGIIPAAAEFVDHVALDALKEAFGLQLPEGTKALLVIELDGLEVALDRQAERVKEICHKNRAIEILLARNEQERAQLWFARKRAFGALGRLTPSYITQDGMVPRSKLPEMMRFVYAVGEKYGLRIANIFHAGDGNLHPCILFDERKPDEVERALKVSTEIIRRCVEVGGSVTGEHGVGLEKRAFMPFMFTPNELAVMRKIKVVFDPDGVCNPGKIFPDEMEVAEPVIVGKRRPAAM